MTRSPLLLPPTMARSSIRFVIWLRWMLLVLAPLLFGITRIGSVGGRMWGVLALFAISNLLLHWQLFRTRSRLGRWVWYAIFAGDLALITAVVMVRGGLRTDTYLLYLLIISETGILLGGRVAAVAGAGTLLAYGSAVWVVDHEFDPVRLFIRMVYMILVGVATTFLVVAERKALVESLTDSKTNLPNLRHFRDLMADEAERHVRNRQPLSVAMLDVDNFRQLNSAIGHPLADMVLEQLAALLVAAKRPQDVLARYGGEEFVMLLPQTSTAEAVAVLEELRHRVEAHHFDLGPGHEAVRVTMSAGVAPVQWSEPGAPALIHADQALLAAKLDGKNRVCIYAA